jgi:hypothetical protein
MTSIALLACLVCSPAIAANFKGVPRIVDGDTLAIGSMKFRLDGIDAPETDQVCLNANGIHWTCGHHLNARSRELSAAMVSGFITWRTKALTPELKWIKVMVGDGFVRPTKPKRLGGVER